MALDLPCVPHEQPINVGQLRMLAEISGVAHGLTRFDLLERESHSKPTVDKRIKYLRNKNLILPMPKSHYRDPAKFVVSPRGRQINIALRRRCPSDVYKQWLEQWIELPIKIREAPVNVGLLKVYALIVSTPDITTTELLEHFDFAKPTMMTRLKWLKDKNLVEQLPKYNLGGSGSPAYFRVTGLGYAMSAAPEMMLVT